MSDQNNLKIIETFLQHQKSAQMQEVLAMIHDDAIWYSDNIDAPWSGQHRGKEEIQQHFIDVKKSVISFSKKQYDIVASQHTNYVYEYAFLECVFSHNNKYFSTDIVFIYEVLDRKIKSYRVLEDSNTLYKKYHLEKS